MAVTLKDSGDDENKKGCTWVLGKSLAHCDQLQTRASFFYLTINQLTLYWSCLSTSLCTPLAIQAFPESLLDLGLTNQF